MKIEFDGEREFAASMSCLEFDHFLATDPAGLLFAINSYRHGIEKTNLDNISESIIMEGMESQRDLVSLVLWDLEQKILGNVPSPHEGAAQFLMKQSIQ